ncbi:hypothetical protein SKAU_G00218450 [Synaphobranchus kaupii]|uniref:Uncharacterized protein n=1 Tax=Synaphobranchus kaupii TaxID=118154 RepID=A0A9Q1FAA9_SYNKA|nr:hypothetical protein SKAU_G00218450 [Synaphobranchus kaupii]
MGATLATRTAPTGGLKKDGGAMQVGVGRRPAGQLQPRPRQRQLQQLQLGRQPAPRLGKGRLEHLPAFRGPRSASLSFQTGPLRLPPPPASSMGYHGSIVGAYAGYPSQFCAWVGSYQVRPGRRGDGGWRESTPAPARSRAPRPPSFMQGLCRDPYCLTYHNAPHLGVQQLHVLRPRPICPEIGVPPGVPDPPAALPAPPTPCRPASPPSLSHPLYTYGFMLNNEPLPPRL